MKCHQSSASLCDAVFSVVVFSLSSFAASADFSRSFFAMRWMEEQQKQQHRSDDDEECAIIVFKSAMKSIDLLHVVLSSSSRELDR